MEYETLHLKKLATYFGKSIFENAEIGTSVI